MTPKHAKSASRTWIILFSSISGLIVVVLGVGLWRSLQAEQFSTPDIVTVETMTVGYEDVVEWFDGFGIAQASESVPVIAHVASVLKERWHPPSEANEGPVEKGEVLARLDDSTFQSALVAANSEAARKSARADIANCIIQAPIKGLVRRFILETGSRVVPGTVLCTVVNLETVEIPVHLPAIVFDRIKVGATCLLTASAANVSVGQGTSWEGSVKQIEQMTGGRSRTFTVQVEVDNRLQPVTLQPGTPVEVRVSGPIDRNAILLPKRTCMGDRVCVIRKNADQKHVVAFVDVDIERYVGDRALVKGTIREGELIVLPPYNHLREGMVVAISDSLMRP